MRLHILRLSFFFVAASAAAQSGFIANNYTAPSPASKHYEWPANASVSLAFNSGDGGRPYELAANMGLNQTPYSVRIVITASGETISDATYEGITQRSTDQASVITLKAVSRAVRVGEPMVLTITPLRDISMAAGAHDIFPAVKVGNSPETGLSFYLRAGPPTTVSIQMPAGGDVELVEQKASCPPTCTLQWPVGSRLRLRARPAAGHLVAWGSPCPNPSTDICVFTVRENQSVSLMFPAGFALTLAPATNGSIMGGSFECPQACEHKFARGTEVTLTAVAAGRSAFSAWTGACVDQPNPCKLTMDANKTVGARFVTR